MPKSNQPKKDRTWLPIFVVVLGILTLSTIIYLLTKNADIALLNPKGMIANEQSWLLVVSTSIMLGFALPIILTIYFFTWKYRENRQTLDYDPKTTENKAFLLFAWGGPLVIVAILASLMLPATQRLEPQRPIESDKEQLTVQVVALDWKWLFIYPKQGIAAVNFTQIPVDTPVRFELTADQAPMSSFWIPHLGGMLYVMTGHVNPLHLMADTIGDYPGNSAEINGRGFANMKFVARVSNQKDFDTWVNQVKQSPMRLDESEYQNLLEPSENNPQTFYSLKDRELYAKIVSKYSAGHHHQGNNEDHGGY